MFCTNCGNKIVAEAKFCANCGSQNVSNDSADKEVEIEVADAPPSPPASKFKRRIGVKAPRGADGQEEVQEVLESRPATLDTKSLDATSMSSGREWPESNERVYYSGLMGKVSDDSCFMNKTGRYDKSNVMMIRDISDVAVKISEAKHPAHSRYFGIAFMLCVPLTFVCVFTRILPSDSWEILKYFMMGVAFCATTEIILLSKSIELRFKYLGKTKSFRELGWTFGNPGAKYSSLVELSEALVKSVEDFKKKI